MGKLCTLNGLGKRHFDMKDSMLSFHISQEHYIGYVDVQRQGFSLIGPHFTNFIIMWPE